MSNKAHTATLNRICQRFGYKPSSSGPHDIAEDDVIIEVETSASIVEAVERLKTQVKPAYIAVTNKEGIRFAKQQVEGTEIGILDPQGNVIVGSGSHEFAMPNGDRDTSSSSS